MSKNGKITERALRRSPLTTEDLENLKRSLNLPSNMAVLEEAIAVLALVSERKNFIIEEKDGSITRIRL